MKRHIVRIGNIRAGEGRPLFLVAGPCVIESEKEALKHAEELLRITSKLDIPFIYKSSYDKANRTSVKSFRGPGLFEGLRILKKVKDTYKIPVLSDVHCCGDIDEASKVLDVIQIPAFLCRQTDLIIAAARSGRPVNVKKGQFMAPWDMRHVAEKIEKAGSRKILFTERGSSFGYNNLVSDMRSIPVMKATGYPVIYDATHSIQLPGGKGNVSGGQREFVEYLSRAAIATGADGLFIETHRNPAKALSDGPNMLKITDLFKLLEQLKRIRKAVKSNV